MLKRLFILGVVAALCSAAAAPALAADAVLGGAPFSDIAGDDAEYELTAMWALGIMTGDAGLGSTVRPEATVNRAEMAKILVNAMGYGPMAQMMGQTQPTFKDARDIPVWAWGYVSLAQQMGLINGYLDGTFGPGKSVTYAEAAAMLIRCVQGHDIYVRLSPLPWPSNYIAHAAIYGFSGPVTIFPQLPALRGDIAKMILATMQVDKLKTDGSSIDDSSLLKGRLVEGEISSFTGTDATIGGVARPLASPYYLSGGRSLSEMQFVTVVGLLDNKTNGKWILIRKTGTSSTASGYVFAGLSTEGTTNYLLFEGNQKIPYRTGVATTINLETGKTVAALRVGDECTVLEGGDGYALSVTAWRWEIERYLTDVDKASGSTDTYVTLAGGGAFSIPTSCPVQVNGASAGRDSLLVNDAVLYALRGGAGSVAARVQATRKSVEGTVSNVTTTTTPSGSTVKVEITRTSGKATYTLNGRYLSPPAMGAHVKYGLNLANELFVLLTVVVDQPYVVITGYSTSSGGSSTVDYNQRGTSRTNIPTTYNFSDLVGHFGRLTFDGTGKVTAFAEMAPGGAEYEVTNRSSTNATVQLIGSSPAVYDFIDNATDLVYRFNPDESYTYIGTGGLPASGGHLVKDPSGTFWVYTP